MILCQCCSLPWFHLDTLLLQQLLQVPNMRRHATLLSLQLLEIAAALRPAGDAVGHIAFEAEVDAVGATFGQGITPDLSYLRVERGSNQHDCLFICLLRKLAPTACSTANDWESWSHVPCTCHTPVPCACTTADDSSPRWRTLPVRDPF